jgi:pyridoxal phosphate enzyme (YggS family)
MSEAVETRIAKNLESIRERVRIAAERSHRDPAEVELVAVTKSAHLEYVAALVRAGQKILAENRARQLKERAEQLPQLLDKDLQGVQWDMVGHLQRNKVKFVLPHVRCIHSVDSLPLIETLQRNCERNRMTVRILLEVNCSAEPTKYGLPAGSVQALVEELRDFDRLELIGLMTMAPIVEDMEETRPFFARLREIAEDLRSEGLAGSAFKHLSMGMSGDYPVAVEEGATMIRLGTAIFEGLPPLKDEFSDKIDVESGTGE